MSPPPLPTSKDEPLYVVIIRGLFAALTLLNTPHVAAHTVSRAKPAAQACGGWRALVDDYGWDADKACRVLVCESGGRPAARNGRYRGLMQIDHGSLDPKINLDQAYAMWKRRGWQPWTCA